MYINRHTYLVIQFIQHLPTITYNYFSVIQPKKKEKRFPEIREFEKNVLPSIQQLILSKQYSREVCRKLMNPNSEKLNVELVLELLKHLCKKVKYFIQQS